MNKEIGFCLFCSSCYACVQQETANAYADGEAILIAISLEASPYAYPL